MPGPLITEQKTIQRRLPVTLKDLDSKQGIVCAYGSSFNIVDDNYPVRDVVKPAAFKKTIQESGPKGAYRIWHLWDHNKDLLLGKPHVLQEDDFGLYFENKILRTGWGNDVLILYEGEVVTEHSIGYFVVKSSYGDYKGERVRFLEELGLLEVSGVPWAMNPVTPTVGLKGNQDAIERLAEQLQRVQHILHTGHFQSDKIAPLLEKHTQEWELLLKAVQPPEPAHERITTTQEDAPMDLEAIAALVDQRVQAALEAKDATGKTTWPLAARDTKWDNGEAHKRIVAWAKKDDGDYDEGKLKSVHFYSPGGDAGQNISAYKLLFADVIGGAVKAIPNAIVACYGAHGVDAVKGVEESDKEAIKKKISTYAAKMRKEFDDAEFEPPWEKDDKEKGRQGRMRHKDFSYLLNHKSYRTHMAAQLFAQQQKDYQGTLVGMKEDLQQEWADAFDALVSCIIRDMWDCKYPNKLGDDPPDAHEVIAADLAQFVEVVLGLVDKSDAADFVPCYDRDCDSFYSPDDDDDDDDYDRWGADLSGLATKEGRMISAANYKAFSGHLKDMAEGHKKAIAAHKAATTMLETMKPSGAGKDESESDTSSTDNTDETPSQGEKGAGRTSRATTPHGAGADDTSRTTPDAELEQTRAAIRAGLEAVFAKGNGVDNGS